MKSKVLFLLSASIFSCGILFSQISQTTLNGNSAVNLEPASRTCAVMDHETELQQQNPSRAADRQAYEQGIQTYIAAHQNSMSTQSVITIPIVVHVIWHTAAQNINDLQVLSQIQVLNQDFGRTNTDAVNTPSVWTGVAANTTIQFCMAQRTPTGGATNGIERLNTTTTAFTTNDAMKHSTSGGLNAWDPTRYLNIWVCNMSGGILGYGEFPTTSVSQTFGVVIQYNAFGSQTIYPAGTYYPTYNLGRTTTHEFSHCFNLFHIWGDDNGACTGTDYCADTPNQGDATFGSPTFPVTTDPCSPGSPGIMFMNYMDYSDDAVMNIFTNNQKSRMLAVLGSAPYNTLQTSNGCQAPATSAPSATFTMSSTSVCAGTSVSFTDGSSGTPTSWTWTFPGGTPTSATTQNVASVIWNTAGTHTVTHTATNGSGTGTTTQTITINALPTITTTTTGGTICSGNSTTITAAGGTSYSWMPGNLSGTTVTISPATTTTYTVTGTNASGCTNTATRTITVNASPTVTATATSTSICAGSSTTLSASGATTYVWNPGAHSGASWTVTPAATTTYTVTGTSGGCTGTATRTITVTPTPTVTTTTTGATICSGNSTTITANGAASYSWLPGSLSGTTVTVSPTTTTTYTVTGTTVGCSATATRTITVNPSPTVTATATSTSICTGSSTTLSASGATTYVWNPGAHSGASWTVTPAATTTYTVTGTSGGCTGTATKTITVTPTPTVTTTTTGGTICNGSSTTITANGGTSYSWMPGSLSGTTVTISPTTTTTYTVTGTSGTCSGTATRTITVNPTPTVTTTTTAGTICSGNSTTITASGGTSYSWMPGSLSGTTVTVSPGVTTTYSVTGTAANGCTGNATRIITVNPTPTVTASASSSSICTGNSITLSASGATTYNWMPGSHAGQPWTTTPATTTTYTVTGTSSGCSSTATVSVTVGAPPTVTASAANPSICVGNNTTLTGSGAGSYTWMPGSLSGTSILINPAATTTYTVTGSSGPGCSNTGTVTVTVNALPSITTTTTAGIICSGNSTSITANGGTSYNWMPGSLSGATIAVIPMSTTTYTVTGTNASGCTNTATQLITVNPSPTVTATSSSSTICAGSTVTLTANGGTTYNWIPGNINGASISDNPSASTTYTVTGTSGACSSTATVSIAVNPLPTVTATIDNATVCAGTSVMLTGNGASTYLWQPINANGSSVTDIPSASVTYSVTGTDANGCANTAQIPVTVNTLPDVLANSTTSSVCAGGSVTLSGGGASSYTWTGGVTDGISFVPANTNTYTVTGTDANGCTNIDITTVTVNSLPTISVSGNNIVCPGTSTTLTANGASTYVWQPGAQTTTSITDAPSATTTYSVTGTDVNGCSNNTTYVVTVDVPPLTPSIAVNGGVLTSTVTGASYQWFLNGNPVSGATSQSYTATQSGNYTVEVYDAAGCGSGQSSVVSDPLGVETTTAINFISVVPNPNDGHFMLNFNVSKSDNYVLEIHNVLGQIIYAETLNNFTGNFSKEIDLGIYGRGMFTISLRNSTQETVIKSITY